MLTGIRRRKAVRIVRFIGEGEGEGGGISLVCFHSIFIMYGGMLVFRFYISLFPEIYFFRQNQK